MEKLRKTVFNGKDNLIMWGAELIGRHLDKVESLIRIEISQAQLDKIATQVAKGAQIAVVPNHQGPYDLVALGMITKIITGAINNEISTGQYPRKDYFPGFVAPMAASVATGDQSRFITAEYELMTDWLENHHLRLVSVVREKDADQYGLDPSANTGTLKQILNQIENGTGLAIFPEGSMEGGRRIMPGSNQRHGIIDVEKPTLLSEMVLRAREKEKNVIIMPVGLSETYTIIDPDILLPSPAALATLAYNSLPLTQPIHKATARVGGPFLSSDLSVDSHYGANSQILKRVSKLIPPEERGIFWI